MRKCRQCKKPFKPTFNTIQPCCSPKCAIEYSKIKREKSYKQEITRLKREFRDNDKKHWKAKARTACHKYIHARDKNQSCVSCGRFNVAKWDAGHYKTRGARTELQFHERNIHKQCQYCNQFNSGALLDYRVELINRIGIDAVEFLEGPHKHHKWDLDDYKDVFWWYTEKLKWLNE